MKDKVKAVIFDLDGTLCDTLQDLCCSVNFALQSQGLATRDAHQVRSFVGDGIGMLVQRACEGASEDVQKRVYDAFVEHYGAHCNDHTLPYEGVCELLRTLKDGKIALALLSNKAQFAVEKIVATHFAGLFDCVVGKREDMPAKPHPSGMNLVLNRLGVRAQDAWYVGDMVVDVQLAKNANVNFVGAGWGYCDRAVLENNGAQRIAPSAIELKEYFC